MNTQEPQPTWKELEAQGIKRCCVTFKSGKRCRKRAIKEYDLAWCAKHGPTLKATIAHHIAVIRGDAKI